MCEDESLLLPNLRAMAVSGGTALLYTFEAYMECDSNSIHGCRIVSNWSCAIGIRVERRHLANDGAEFVHRNGHPLWGQML